MNYELAKELKDAGFLDTRGVREAIRIQGPGGDWIEPTLSELIAACGERFHVLRYQDAFKNWQANDGDAVVQGTTPEEAVARLWLALNNNQ